jgi:hypothetical protein
MRRICKTEYEWREESVTELEDIVIELDKRIIKTNNLIAAKPSLLRDGMKLAYQDIREYIQYKRKIKGELP